MFLERANARVPYIAGNWYPAIFGDTVVSMAGGANIGTTVTRLTPFDVRTPVTVTDLGVRITTLSAGGNVRLGIYESSATTGKATGAVLGSVTVATDSAAVVTASLSSAIALYPGRLYWAAAQVDNATAVCQVQSISTAAGSIALGDASASNVSSAATTGFNCLNVTTVGYSNGLTDMSAVTQSPASSTACALMLFKAQA